ncbi:MAG: ribonuclease D [Chloroflexi bacterium]|nr:ribonuclease D [Chloroflexota bacterium]MDL1885537.1 ribonuclease D [Anaerolineae bacterium CFX8]
MNWPFPPARYIDHDHDFSRLVDELASQPLIAIDTESNSLYAYRERICLIQISTRSADYIVDPLRVANLRLLGPLLADPSIEKVFHAAEYDLMCLKRDYGFSVSGLFDTMVAARICGHKAIGLDKMLSLYVGVTMDKSHQRDDWGQRPLSEESLLYAQMDTHYLPLLRDRLHDELTKIDALEEAHETFVESTRVAAANHQFNPEGYWRIGFNADLNRRQMALLRELYLLREEIAEERDTPPFKVFSDSVLVGLALAAPYALDRLKGIPGMTRAQIERYGRRILQAIERGKRAPLPQPPPRPATNPVVAERYSALRAWRKTRAEARGVESDVILSKDALWLLAQRGPGHLDDLREIDGLGPWRIATYGQEILAVLKPFARR